MVLGAQTIEFSSEARYGPFEVSEMVSCVIQVDSQLPIEHWHEYLNDPTLADAIMDRLIHCAHKIHLQGKESMRKRTGKDGAKD